MTTQDTLQKEYDKAYETWQAALAVAMKTGKDEGVEELRLQVRDLQNQIQQIKNKALAHRLRRNYR